MSKYLDRIQQGLCGSCGETSKAHICDKCKSRYNQCRKARRTKKKSSGKCIWCNNKRTKGIYCKSCKTKADERERIRYYESTYGCKWNELENLSGIPITIGVDAEIDHIVPKARGGINAITNYQWIHERVNRMKSTIPEREFIEWCKKIAKYCEP